MFDKIFIESKVQNHPQTVAMLKKLRRDDFDIVEKIEDYFGRYKKPYLHKRESLNLWIGRKEGDLIKETPPAYGKGNSPHYYFVHAYNCIYECEYCYLQGYFNSPDIVLFVNHDEICEEIQKICATKHRDQKEVWFHAGEFSDSLALSGLTNEWSIYWDAFKKIDNAFLELRTKSNNIRTLLELEPLQNIVISFSLSTSQASKSFDRKTPPLEARLKSIQKLVQHGYKIGIHLDPIIYNKTTMQDYEQLLEELQQIIPTKQFAYMSFGVVRFSKDSFFHFQKNYPNSKILSEEMIKGSDGKVRYPRPLRLALLNSIKKIAVDKGFPEEQLYLCMEEA